MYQTLDRLSIHMSYEVTGPQSSLMSRAALFNALDK